MISIGTLNFPFLTVVGILAITVRPHADFDRRSSMLKHRLAFLCAVVALLVVVSLPAAADGWHASVPFDFVVQGVTFPAGTYAIISTTSPRVVIVRSETNVKQSFLMLLPTGESLVNGNAQLPLTPKLPGPVKVASRSGQK